MRIEQKATVASMSVAAILVSLKMIIGVMSGSVAVLASAIDSLLDLTVSAFNFFALGHAQKEPDDKFNFGRGKLEPLAAVVEGTIISMSAIFVLYQAIMKIANDTPTQHLQESIVVMVLSIVITGALVLFLNYIAKKTKNMVIRADALHYKTDLFSNGAVLLALGLISMTGVELIDPVLGIGIAVYMFYSAFPIVKEGVLMLLDVALEEEDVNKIKDLLESEKEITTYHFLSTRQAGSHIYISVHLVFNVTVTLYDAHVVGDKIEMKLKKLFPEYKVHTLVHLDPYDDSEMNETEDEY
ncbi:cation diffusion facilitator family transporter [Sulfurimonas sp. HSL-1716]|uniref:cation diffusion facilitator family transporter n=1 Tax=Hydrocurvibacter sulfurireducens TaxID=3131937 RepID=UPI0031F879CF